MPNDDPEISALAVPGIQEEKDKAIYTSNMATKTTESKMHHPTLTKIIGKPNRISIQNFRAELLANACSVHSDGGDGLLGHAHIVLTEAEYNANSMGAIPFGIPNKPAVLVHDPAVTHKTMYVLDKAYDLELATWRTYQSTASTLKGQVLALVHDIYLRH